MARPQRERRGKELWCEFHHAWHPESEFGLTQSGSGSTPRLRSICRAAHNDRRRQVRDQDEALYIVRSRAKQIAMAWNKAERSELQCGAPDHVTTEYVMSPEGLNYISKVIEVRAYLTWPSEGICKSCGRHYHERAKDYDPNVPKPERFQFDHIEPPRGPRDFARLHARNLQVLDKECNCGKRDQQHAQWLDEQAARQQVVVAHIQQEEARFDLLATAGPPFKRIDGKSGSVDQLLMFAS